MSDMVKIKVEGLAELEAQLLKLGAELGARVLAQAARKSFVPVLEAARAKVAEQSGELRDAIKLTTKKPSEGDTVVVTGLRIGAGRAGSEEAPPKSRWHFVEFGTARQAARPFLRPALDENAQVVVDGLKTELDKAIARAIRRKAKGR